MRKSKAFRPDVADALESRLVLNGASSISPLSLYKADLVGRIQGVFNTLENNVDSAFYSSANFDIRDSGPAQYAILQSSVQNEITNATSQLDNLLAPLKKSGGIIGVVYTEMQNLSAESNGILNQLETSASTTNDTNGLVSKVNPNGATLAGDAIDSMMYSVSQAVQNQAYLFSYAPGIYNKPGKAFLASMWTTYNTQLTAPFSKLTSGLQAAIAAYPASPTPTDTLTFDNAVYTQLGTLAVSANNVFTANGASSAVMSAMRSQVTGLNQGSVYQVVTDLVLSSYSTGTTYPSAFVNYVINNVDSVLQTDLAATGSA